MNVRAFFIIVYVCLLLSLLPIAGCFGGGGGGGGGDGESAPQGNLVPNAHAFGCFLEDYSDPVTSDYILPYQVA